MGQIEEGIFTLITKGFSVIVMQFLRFLSSYDEKKCITDDEGLTPETSALLLFTVVNLRFQLSC